MTARLLVDAPLEVQDERNDVQLEEPGLARPIVQLAQEPQQRVLAGPGGRRGVFGVSGQSSIQSSQPNPLPQHVGEGQEGGLHLHARGLRDVVEPA